MAVVKSATNEEVEDVPIVDEIIGKTKGLRQLKEITRIRVMRTTEPEHRFYINPNSMYYPYIYLLHLVNIIATAVLVPLQV